MAEKAVQREQNKKLDYWTDLWFNEYKKTGYVSITDFNKQYFYGLNDVSKVINATKGKKKRFISINAFDVNFQEKHFSREAERLKQIRNIAIDIDQYKLGISINEALDEIQALIVGNTIPEPNLILTSRGIQLFYSIDRGASPEMAWLAGYITEQLINKLEYVGADSNAKDMSRVMRVPNSINERNNAPVKPAIWNNTAYSLQDLQRYCKPLEKFGTRKKTKNNIVHIPHSYKLVLFYKTNYARLTDLRKLLELRKGDLTNMRNVFLYMYSYHQSLVLNTQSDVLKSVKNTFKDTYSTTDKPMTKREFETTVKSAYKDAERFFNHFIDNGYTVIYKHLDGIKKPYKTNNAIKKLNITLDEQRFMRSFRSTEIAKEQDKERKQAERRNAGMGTMSQYNAKRQEKKKETIQLAKKLKGQGKKQIEIAEIIGVSRVYVSNLLKM